ENDPDDYNSEEDQNENDNKRALELKFSIGYNTSMTGAVHNLTLANKRADDKRKYKEIFFPAAHTGVIYNYETGDSKLLQGHVRLIFNLFLV
ncbi:MAG: hypothetical protein MJ252_17300, partial [archaeon]|nr:hypothetical protein [archaeon]